jgi:chromosome segregation ATPase
MIEPIMYVGIGFLVASLLVIGLIPLVHARAVRLTMKRLEAVTPMSMAEIQADKDQLRAEFAMSTRRLEMSVEQMKAKTTSQLAEIGKKSEAVGKLKLELGEKTAALFALEAKERQLIDDLQAAQKELSARAGSLQDTERMLAGAHAQIGELTTNFNDSSSTADSQRVELIATRAQVDVLKGQIEVLERETKDLTGRLNLKTQEAEATSRLLVDERGRSEALGGRISELERQLIAQTTETEILDRRVQELLGRVDEQGRFLAEREFASDQLRNEATEAAKREADIRAEFSDTEQRRKAAHETLNSEKSVLEVQLAQAQNERAKLLRDIDTMKREAESAWAAERMENAVMRERINDVAAEVARLTSLLEGPGNQIDAILAEGARAAAPDSIAPSTGNGAAAGNGAAGNGAAAAGGGKGSLADRIRALQSRASRLPQPSGA